MAITLDGSNASTVGVINSKTAQNSTSGTNIDFTSIPSGVKRITVMFNGVSTSGTSIPQIQLGTSSGFETSGYTGAASSASSTWSGTSAFSSGFLTTNSSAAANVVQGSVQITNLTGNVWTCMGLMTGSNSAYIQLLAGVKSLSGTLTQLRITTVNGTDTFDAGSINILYE